jgi:hypothetical protein
VKRLAIAIAILLTLGSSYIPAHAEVQVSDYQRLGSDSGAKQLMEAYVAGLGRGYFLANAFAGGTMFCMPNQFVPQGANFTAWIEQAIERGVSTDENIEILLFIEMQRIFPC